MTLPVLDVRDPAQLKSRAVLNALLLEREIEFLGFRWDATTLYIRFRVPPTVPFARVHVQSTAAGEGDLSAYDPANYTDSLEVDCREDRMQDYELAGLVGGERYVAFLIPIQVDGTDTKILYDGQGSSPDRMSFMNTGTI